MKGLIQAFILGIIIILITSSVWVVAESLPGENSGKNILICVHPGYSGFSERSADLMANLLKNKGYEVKIKKSGIKNEDFVNLTALIITGPVYAGKPSGQVRDFFRKIPANATFPILVYLTYGDKNNLWRSKVEVLIKEKNLTLLAYSGFSQPKEKKDPDGWRKSVMEFLDSLQ